MKKLFPFSHQTQKQNSSKINLQISIFDVDAKSNSPTTFYGIYFFFFWLSIIDVSRNSKTNKIYLASDLFQFMLIFCFIKGLLSRSLYLFYWSLNVILWSRTEKWFVRRLVFFFGKGLGLKMSHNRRIVFLVCYKGEREGVSEIRAFIEMADISLDITQDLIYHSPKNIVFLYFSARFTLSLIPSNVIKEFY